MTSRTATCRCGQLRAESEGEPVRVSVCHCLDCQRRSGSAFAVQARWPSDKVTLVGDRRDWETKGDNGRAVFTFCPECGSTVAYRVEAQPEFLAVAVGAFADPSFPSPEVSGWEERKHAWVEIVGEAIEHFE